MDGRSYTLLIALVMAGSALTGCIQNPDWLNTSDAEVSAQENARLANDAALAWNENAVLVGLMAFELSESPDPRIDADPDPGNGLAPAWWYVYCATEEAQAEAEADDEEGFRTGGGEETSSFNMPTSVRAFKVLADGTVTSEEDAEALAAGMDHSMAESIGEWTVDSDDALAAAKADEGFAKVAQGFNATVVEGIAHHEGVTSWWVSAMSVDGFVVATVDAKTGELLEVTPIDMDFDMPEFQWGAANPELEGTPVWLEGEGVATAGDEPVETPFTTTSPVHGTMTVDYSADQFGDGLHIAILDADGELVAVDHIGGWGPEQEGTYEFDVELEEAGDYVLSLGYMSSLEFTHFVPLPTGGAVEYTYVLDLMPGEAEHEDDEDEG
jgi:hypothetical protein